jgi:hypothetical protein
MKINHDVIIGKRNSNCISCGVMSGTAKERQVDKIKKGPVDFDYRFNSKFESLTHVKGLDGRLYIS